ncbi:MAG: GNAT family N-acetyltransferase [Acidimicrobiales bacterium]
MTAYLVPITAAATLRSEVLEQVRRRLAALGYAAVYTAAVGRAERDRLVTDGFEVVEELHLLRHDLHDPVERPRRSRSTRVRRGRRRDHADVLLLDAGAFGPFWRLDVDGLHEALAATPVSRLRIVRDDGFAGYAITGKSGAHGYLQRLAVSPRAQSRGVGRALLADTLRWLRQRHATSVLVNTQLDNERALALYESSGFRRQDERLAVLHRELR